MNILRCVDLSKEPTTDSYSVGFVSLRLSLKLVFLGVFIVNIKYRHKCHGNVLLCLYFLQHRNNHEYKLMDTIFEGTLLNIDVKH